MLDIKEISIFLSSPGDLAAEREIAKSVCDEINLDRGRMEGFHLTLLRWETHAHPGMDERSQSIINKDIGDQYDIFLGLMGNRFGTPTGTWRSGTEEEFRIALDRRNSTGKPSIHFYFSLAPTIPSLIDPDQLKMVHEFRNRLPDLGILYWQFTGPTDLRIALHRHISKEISDLLHNQKAMLAKVSDVILAESSFDPLSNWKYLISVDPTVAIMEMLREGTKSLNLLTAETNGISSAISKISKGIGAEAKKIAVFNKSAHKDQRQFITIIKNVIRILDDYSEYLIGALPKLYRHMNEALTKLQRAINISRANEMLSAADAMAYVGIIQTLKSAMPTILESLESFEKALSNWPNLFENLDFSKKKALSLSKDLTSFFLFSIKTADSILSDVKGDECGIT